MGGSEKLIIKISGKVLEKYRLPKHRLGLYMESYFLSKKNTKDFGIFLGIIVADANGLRFFWICPTPAM